VRNSRATIAKAPAAFQSALETGGRH